MTQQMNLPDLDKIDYKPLYLQLSDALAEYIRGNRLSAGDLFPSENELLARYDVSRSTVRQAMQHLEAKELIHKVRGKGTFVTEPGIRKWVRGFQNLEATMAEQGIVVRNTLLRYEEISAPPHWAGEMLPVEGPGRACLVCRLKTLDGRPLALEERCLPADVGSRFTRDDFMEEPVYDLIESLEEFEILHIAYTMSTAPLIELEAEALQARPGTPAIRRIGFYHGRNGKPIMSSRLTFLPEKLELRFEFRKTGDTWSVVSVV